MVGQIGNDNFRTKSTAAAWRWTKRWTIGSAISATLVYILLTRSLEAVWSEAPESVMVMEQSSMLSHSITHDLRKNTPPRPLLLDVPFYVYETDTLNWRNHSFQSTYPDYSEFKHSDDLWLYGASQRHPMRTTDPNRAKLFFVPVLLNAIAERRMCIFVDATERCFVRPGAAYRFVDKNLGHSEYFQRHRGSDHVVVVSHWLDPPHRIPNLLSCNLINFEGHLPRPGNESFSLPKIYVGRPCQNMCHHPSCKEYDFAMISTMKGNNPKFQSRQDICDWLEYGHYSVSACGQGSDQCPALPQARYGFHPRGDTWGSQRVIDTVLSLTVPLFTNDMQYNLLPPFVPWRDLSYLVDVSTKEAFQASLNNILARPPSEYLDKIRIINEHMHLFDHSQIYQFDAYMYTFAKKLGLQ